MRLIRNKKTTVLGLAGVAGAVLNFILTKDVASFATSISTALGLILAQDGGV